MASDVDVEVKVFSYTINEAGNKEINYIVDKTTLSCYTVYRSYTNLGMVSIDCDKAKKIDEIKEYLDKQ